MKIIIHFISVALSFFSDPITISLPRESSEYLLSHMLEVTVPYIPNEYKNTIFHAAKKYDIPIHILANTITSEDFLWREKGKFGPQYNGSYDLGLVHVNSYYLSWFQQKFWKFDPFNPHEAIYFAAAYLDWLRLFSCNWEGRVVKYKTGPNRSKKDIPGWIVKSAKQVCSKTYYGVY